MSSSLDKAAEAVASTGFVVEDVDVVVTYKKYYYEITF